MTVVSDQLSVFNETKVKGVDYVRSSEVGGSATGHGLHGGNRRVLRTAPRQGEIPSDLSDRGGQLPRFP